MHSSILSRRCWLLADLAFNSQAVRAHSNPHNSFSYHRRWLSGSPSCRRHRHTLSNFWTPTGGIESSRDSQDDSHALLVKAGYLRQTHPGIFHMLPLGYRVQQKLEDLVDKHMSSLGASKVALSSITSEDLWRKTGRFVGHGGELFAFKDRRDNNFLLSPTHEEEITALVAATTHSYKELPLRLYQTSRKYRDEARPRQGLLRGREFIMKDLYTFDHTEQEARQTYEQVQLSYRALFDELKLPYLVARADSGNMGGNLSHEYHFVSPKGEDNVISCSSCGDTINDELSMTAISDVDQKHSAMSTEMEYWCGISKDRSTLVVAWFPRTCTRDDGTEVTNHANLNVVGTIAPDLDLSVEDPIHVWNKANSDSTGQAPRILELVDARLPAAEASIAQQKSKLYERLAQPKCEVTPVKSEINGQAMQLTSTLPGDKCPKCNTGRLGIDRAIEIGHTFYLGTRYSKPLSASVVDKDDRRVPMEMGCHGIGVTRLLGSVASILYDSKGLNWPAVIAPFQVVVVPGKGHEEDAVNVYDMLSGGSTAGAAGKASLDAILDDRDKAMGWKLNDADLVGYPVIVVLGRAWKNGRKAEVQCRRLGVKEQVEECRLSSVVGELLARL
ncbi:hypothetical protein AAFC00_005408 [Neodothiora populina]|uniref:proline--tRNA ligase n=1 Tax=Neodothiora populina TaxID=2781224 RepID=A0ABR3PL45_9PEZI